MLAFFVFVLHALEHVPEVEVQHARCEAIYAETCSVFALFSVVIVFIIVIHMVMFLRQHSAQGFDVFLACFGIVETIGFCCGDQVSIQLSGVG